MNTIIGFSPLPFKHGEQEFDLAVHMALARSNRAMHLTQLGISRWTSGSTLVASEVAMTPMSSLAWHTAVNRSFETWLEAGGFAQPGKDTLAA